MRELFLEVVHKLYPGITPRHDFDICALASGNYAGPLTNEAAYTWLDEEIRIGQVLSGNSDTALQGTSPPSFDRCMAMLDQPGQIGGVRCP